MCAIRYARTSLGEPKTRNSMLDAINGLGLAAPQNFESLVQNRPHPGARGVGAKKMCVKRAKFSCSMIQPMDNVTKDDGYSC